MQSTNERNDKNEVKKYWNTVTFNSPHWPSEAYVTDDFAVKNGCYAITVHGPKETVFVIPINEIHELRITPVCLKKISENRKFGCK